ncbi:VOC family protein [Paraburkholderia tuberum]|uniref:Catechol 2,3-dioxygenase n=1 Tax=Paraburkholderia tuberum TaxID=157910 RepID=A0A1H1KFT0_9BURK|nr:VOC family protein [Paraburkholderia tuberum]SDR61154.1 Catechol 2,3-dioxygenase [Paraburkholderia tuberum]
MSLENWTPSNIDIEKARAIAQQRRASNKVKMLHHHAFRCRSAEETRAFYEGLLGFPLVAACIEPIDPLTNEPKPYMHLYFELADGSALAFFDYPVHFKPADFAEVDQFCHHIAMEVEGGDATIDAYKKKLEGAGVEVFEIDHGYCRSIYFYDPNGLRLEFATNVPVSERFFADRYQLVDADMEKWRALRAQHYGDVANA